MKLGIIGQGFVGQAIYHKFKNFYDILTYDLVSSKCNSSFNELINQCEVIFICLPTPMNKDKSCDLSLVENVINEINQRTKNSIIVIKSTIPPGSTSLFNQKYKNLSIVFNPEFLTERNAIKDFENQKRIILGGPRDATSKLKQIFLNAFENIHIIKTGSDHAEFIKYFTNSFLATKVSFSNEMFQLANKFNLDYDKIVEYAILDKRLGKTHFNVPGPDGDYGFGGHCFPKDLNALIHITEKNSSINNVLKAALKTNDEVRKNRDWEKMKGRAIN